MRMLIVEDERRLAEALAQIFSKYKFECDISNDGSDGLDNALSGIYDVIILDIMLPKMNGFDVLKEIRENKIETPIILLTAKDEISDKISGLDLGADDYVTKPFVTEELVARVRAVLRRKGEMIFDNLLAFGDLSLNLSTYELSVGDSAVKLAAKEYNIMELLMRYKNNVVTKEMLLEKVWGYDTDAEYNNAEVYISFLRKKLTYLKSNVAIKTVRGVGYNLEVQSD